MVDEKQSPMMWWFDNNGGPHVNAKAKEIINLLSSVLIGATLTSGVMRDDIEDLNAHSLNLIKTAFNGLYASGESENFDEENISAVYTHLTGESIEELHNEWAVDMEMALAQNRALLGIEIICAACNKPIEGKDLDNRHWGHETDCTNRDRDEDSEEDMEDCTCNLEYHEECCPDCK